MPIRAFSVCVSLLAATSAGGVPHASAQTGTSTQARSAPNTEVEALAIARAAFEYRDFDQVIEVLDSWVHPPRILDPERMRSARQLLGVSLHVEGNERGAREEFAQLLLLDPGHQLDPFVVPPRVIATFEEVRQQLAPRLEESPPPPPARVETRTVEVPHPALMWLPFGISQAALDEPASALALGGLQVVGLALHVVGFVMASQVGGENSDPAAQAQFNDWVAVQYVGLGGFVAAYGASVVQGGFLVERRRRAAEAERAAYESAPELARAALPRPEPAGWIHVGVSF